MTTRFTASRRGALAGLVAVLLAFSPVSPALAEGEALEEKGYALGDVPLGAEDAPVTVIEYASLTCPHCAAFHEQTYGVMKQDYIDTGKVRFILRDVYFDQFGLWGSMLARCGGATNYHRMVDMLLSRQREWYLDHVNAYNQTKNPRPIIDELFRIGRLAGMSNERMTACLEDQAYLERLVSDFQTFTGEDEIRSTPTFIINGEKVSGAQSPAAMAALIDKHL